MAQGRSTQSSGDFATVGCQQRSLFLFDREVDSDQQFVNEELFRSPRGGSAAPRQGPPAPAPAALPPAVVKGGGVRVRGEGVKVEG